MRIDNVLVEHLPRLQCVNVHIKYTSPTLTRPPDLKLTNDRIEITERNSTSCPATTSTEGALRIAMPRSLYINAPTMSLLIHGAGSISFRVCTNRAQTFDEEYLCRAMPATRIVQHARTKMTPSVQPGQRVQLKCMECLRPLSEPLTFERVLELPSENLDADEWFCHHHKGDGNGHGHDHDHGSADELDEADEELAEINERASNLAKLAARPLDLLFGQFCFALSLEHMHRAEIHDKRFVHCVCGIELGEYLRHNGLAKLWNERIGFMRVEPGVGEASRLLAPSTLLFPGDLGAQFVKIVRKVIEDFDFLMSTVALPQTIRCLFNGHPDGHNTYLFVHVMNANLDVWRSSAAGGGDDEQPVSLDQHRYIKIMYQAIELTDAVPPPPLVVSWQSDTTVNCIDLSERMLAAALFVIDANSMLVPSCHRQVPGGFKMSYLW